MSRAARRFLFGSKAPLYIELDTPSIYDNYSNDFRFIFFSPYFGERFDEVNFLSLVIQHADVFEAVDTNDDTDRIGVVQHMWLDWGGSLIDRPRGHA